MKNVSYKRVITNASAAADEITSRTKKKNKLYTISFIVLAILVLFYIMYAMSITTYDGFMVSNNVSIRPSTTMVVVDYKVKPGDLVKEGDTLYSYININRLSYLADPSNENRHATSVAEATIRRDRLRSELSRQIQTRDSLRGVIKRTEEDVYLGVATKEYAEQLEWDLFLVQKGAENTSRLIAIEQDAIEDATKLLNSASAGVRPARSYSYTERLNGSEIFGQAYNYHIAYVDMIVVDIHSHHGALVLTGEPVLTYMPYNNDEMLDMHAKMLLDPSQFASVSEGMVFSVYAGTDYIGKVRTTYQATFISDENVHTQNKYERDFKQQDIVVRAEFLDKDCVYRKYQVNKYPLQLTRYKWDWLNKLMHREHQRRRARVEEEESYTANNPNMNN